MARDKAALRQFAVEYAEKRARAIKAQQDAAEQRRQVSADPICIVAARNRPAAAIQPPFCHQSARYSPSRGYFSPQARIEEDRKRQEEAEKREQERRAFRGVPADCGPQIRPVAPR